MTTLEGIDDLPEFSALIDSESFRDVCKSYAELFGVGIKVFSADGQKIVDVRANTSDHCGYLFSVHATRVMCTHLVEKIKACPLEGDQPLQIDCFSGLRYRVMPLLYEGVLLGRLIFGPFAPSELQGPPKDLGPRAAGLDMQRLGTYLAAIPRVPEDAALRILENMRAVVDVLIHTAYKAAVTSRLHIASTALAFKDLERSNASLKSANERLADLDRLKSNFVATVSHELRTPLTSVIGYAEMLLEGMAGELNNEQRVYIGIVLEKGESLLNLITQVLDLSRVEAGNGQINKTLTDVREVIRLALSDVQPQLIKRNLTFTQAVDEAVTPLLADFDKLRRIVTNLLGNAVKFTPPGGYVRLHASVVQGPAVGSDRPDMFEPERNRWLQITVEDSGIGIASEETERIFDSFYQVDGTSTRQFGGAGLGLSIVRNFVLAHRGQVEVRSVPQRGSTFIVKLPYMAEPAQKIAAGSVDGMAIGTP